MDIGGNPTIRIDVDLRGADEAKASVTDLGAKGESGAKRFREAFASSMASAERAAHQTQQAISALTAILAEQVRVSTTAAQAEQALSAARRESTRAARESREAKAAELKLGQQMADELERERTLLLQHAEALALNTRMEQQNAAAARLMALAHGEALQMEKARAAASSLSGRAGAALGSLGIGGGALGGLAAVGIGVAGLRKVIDETKESQAAFAQLEAAVRSTGGAAGFTADQLADMAGALQDTTRFSDEAIERSQALLLTFTNIRGDNFKRAVIDIADMAERLGGLESAALQVGKALQDPEQGITALRRSGVSFSETQQEVIKDLYKTGQVAQAQTLILRELEKEFGGSAAAARNTLGGALDNLTHQFGELFELTRSQAGPVIDLINGLANAFKGLKVSIVAALSGDAFGGFAAVMGNARQALANASKVGPVTYQTIGQPLPGPPHVESIEEGQARIALLAQETAVYMKLREEYVAQREVALAAMRIRVEQNAADQDAVKNVGQLGYALERSRINQEARTATDKAWTEVNATARREMMASIESHRVAQIAVLNHKTALEDAATATKFFGEAQTQLGAIAARNKAITDAETKETADRIKQAQKYADDVENIWRRGIAKIVTDGTKSFRDFFEDVLQLFSGLMDRMVQRARELGQTIEQFGGSKYTALGIGASGIAGGFAGYGVGSQVGGAVGGGGLKSALLGSFAGAATGAAAGTAVLPGVGTIVGLAVGEIAGLAGALISGSKAAKERKVAEEQLRQSLELSLAQMRVLAGTATPLSLALTQNAEAFKSLRMQTEAAFAGRKNEAEREARLRELDSLEVQRTAQIRAEAAAAEEAAAKEAAAAAEAAAQQLCDLAKAIEETAASARKANQDSRSNSLLRYLDATGQGDAAFAFRQSLEYQEEVAKGLDDGSLLWLRMAQAAEADLREQQKADAIAQQQRQAQIEALDSQAQSLQKSISVQQEIVNNTRQTIDALRKYSDSLKLGSLTPLGPEARYEEARRQYLSVADAATRGDLTAAGNLPGAANAFLEQSRNMFASTQRYAEDFRQVQTFVGSIIDQYGAQLSVEERMLATMQAQLAALQAQINAMKDVERAVKEIPPPLPPLPIALPLPLPVTWVPGDYGTPTDPARPIPREPGLPVGGPGGGRPGSRSLDDVYERLNGMHGFLSDLSAKAFTQVDLAGRTYGVIATTSSQQTEYQRQIRDNTKATADGIRDRPIGNGNGGL